MAPTEILAKQHFNLAKKIFENLNLNIDFLTGKTDYKKRKKSCLTCQMEKLNY